MYYRLYDERDQGLPIGITLFGERPALADEVAWFARVYREVLDGERVVSVGEVDGRVVGNCTIGRMGPGASSEAGHVGVLGILVDAPYRGHGVGTALLHHALGQARQKFEVVRLSVFSINEGAQRLYRRFGFVPCGHVPRAVRRGSQYFDSDEMVLVFDRPSPGSTAGSPAAD